MPIAIQLIFILTTGSLLDGKYQKQVIGDRTFIKGINNVCQTSKAISTQPSITMQAQVPVTYVNGILQVNLVPISSNLDLTTKYYVSKTSTMNSGYYSYQVSKDDSPESIGTITADGLLQMYTNQNSMVFTNITRVGKTFQAFCFTPSGIAVEIQQKQ